MTNPNEAGPMFRHISTCPLENDPTSAALYLEYVDRQGTTLVHREIVSDLEDQEFPPEYLAALQLDARLREQLRALQEFSDQFVAKKFPR